MTRVTNLPNGWSLPFAQGGDAYDAKIRRENNPYTELGHDRSEWFFGWDVVFNSHQEEWRTYIKYRTLHSRGYVSWNQQSQKERVQEFRAQKIAGIESRNPDFQKLYDKYLESRKS